MFSYFMRKSRGAAHGESGVALVLFAAMIVPILLLLAIAIDFGQVLVAQRQLQGAADAAALDIAASGLSQAQAQARAQAFLNANFATQNAATLLQPAVTVSNGIVTVTATATVNTVFLTMFGYNSLSATVFSQVTGALHKLEVVLVLDNTGSMNQLYGNQTGIDGLKSAATTLVNTLFANDPTGQYVKIGVVPFTAAVNVGTQYASTSWMDTAGAGSLTRENLNVPAGQGLISFISQVHNTSWGGCVRQRTEPYDIEDVAPTSSVPDTLFTPYVAPDEPDSMPTSYDPFGIGFYNNYLQDGSCAQQTTQLADQQCVAKYTNANIRTTIEGAGQGPNFVCTVQPIIRLTNDQTAILNEINAMYASGATVIPAGLMWGWHLISPNGPFGDGVSYSDTSTIKVIILLTDGFGDVQLTVNYQPPTAPTNGFNQSIYNAYGYGSGPHLNQISLPSSLQGVQDQPDYNLDQKEIALCNNIKAVTDASGNPGRILLYTIGFGTVINSSSLQILSQCATNASYYYYNPTSQELVTTFQNIAVGLNKLRISR